MSESDSMAQKSLADGNDSTTPEDVATLYSWANLHGAKYRDFSASRAQAREEARLRAEEAAAEEKRRQEEEAERQRQEEAQIAARLAAEAAEAARAAEAERLAEIARQAEAERQAVLAAQEAQRQAALQRSWQPPPPEAYQPENYPANSTSASATSQMQSLYSRFIGEPASAGVATDASAAEQAGIRSRPFGYAEDTGRGMNPPLTPAPQRSAYRAADPAASAAHEPAQHPEYAPDRRASGQSAQPYAAPAFPDYPAPQYALPHYPAEPYGASEPFANSPWNLADARESRESATRPAWLAPELPAAPPQQRAYPQANPPANPQASQPGVPMYAQSTSYPQVQSSSSYPVQYPAQAPVQSSGSGSGSGQNPGPVDDTLLGSRDRIANRWYALKSVFDPQAAPVEQVQTQPPARVPVLAIFSLAGGVGKTSLVASLGRALSSRGERVLLVDTAAYGLLPFFFGARDQRPGMLRTFNPPGASTDAPIQLVTIDPESPQPEHAQEINLDPHAQQVQNQDWLAQEVGRYTRGANRVLVDLPTASGSTTRRVLRLNPVVLVPVLPDMNSVVSVGAIEGFFRHNGTGIPGIGNKQIMPYYVLNQFDYSLPLHLDVREILREQIGDRLLPFALRRSPAVSEALAEGMTVMDYAPNAVVAEDYANLAGWVRSLSAPATQSYRGVRWSER